MAKKVTIVVEGGLVQHVYADDEDLQLKVIDCDSDDDTECEEIEASLNELIQSIESGEMHSIY